MHTRKWSTLIYRLRITMTTTLWDLHFVKRILIKCGNGTTEKNDNNTHAHTRNLRERSKRETLMIGKFLFLLTIEIFILSRMIQYCRDFYSSSIKVNCFVFFFSKLCSVEFTKIVKLCSIDENCHVYLFKFRLNTRKLKTYIHTQSTISQDEKNHLLLFIYLNRIDCWIWTTIDVYVCTPKSDYREIFSCLLMLL